MKTLSLAALTLTFWALTCLEKYSQAGFAQPGLRIAPSRPITAAELESISNLWKTEPPILRPILDQSFSVYLSRYGNVYFLSFFDQSLPDRPPVLTHWLVGSGRVLKELPFSEKLIPKSYFPFSLDAVVFTDLYFDGLEDIYTIASYITGVGPTGAIPFPVITVYGQREDGSFVIWENVSLELTTSGASTAAEVEKLLPQFLPSP
ncbi:MAG: hypothetical protein Q6K80_10910 [Thermostichus sp. DG_1_6_bins_120]|uniref:hypothetical protein n=1 Tax=uncultured Thermosynechococcus sp. TaxID=436945 RepID=UPI0026262794|nr:hypothetical protein [uncultured Thermosynechococcus sp.]